jgi:hypothetical protein
VAQVLPREGDEYQCVKRGGRERQKEGKCGPTTVYPCMYMKKRYLLKLLQEQGRG